jgi:hypothetical protein
MANLQTLRNADAYATRNPIQPRPAALPEDRDRKRGPGTLRTAASLTGPSVQAPLINAAAQSARSNQVNFGPAPSVNRGEGTNARIIDRASLSLDQADNYGTT